jgi:hypothetical protein
MLLKTTLPPFAPWTTAPSIDTLRSLYDASADHWDDYLARLGQSTIINGCSTVRLFTTACVTSGRHSIFSTAGWAPEPLVWRC